MHRVKTFLEHMRFFFNFILLTAIGILRYMIFIAWLASECSKRDTYKGNTIENQGCLFVYVFF